MASRVAAGEEGKPALESSGSTTLPSRADRVLPSGLAILVIGDGEIATHRLPQSGSAVIGRSEACDIRIADPVISRRHAAIHMGPPLQVEDLGSSNGTAIRDKILRDGERAPLACDEIVDLGGVMVIVRAADPLGAESVAPAIADEPDPDTSTGYMQSLRRLIDKVAAGTISVLLRGETGVGKEVTARMIHRASPRSDRPFLPLNCAALSPSLLESELFGHERGAFTGAVEAKPGLLEMAEGGTVFLDEIGELPMPMQVKLLRVLEERAVLRVGGLEPRPIDVRFIAATNRDLEAEMDRGGFRRDLYYRLDGMSIAIPPLRERTDEISELCDRFASEAARQLGRVEAPSFSGAALELLCAYEWPGNIRELRNVVDRAVLLCDEFEIRREHLPLEKLTPSFAAGDDLNRKRRPQAATARSMGELREQMAEAEKARILGVLRECGGNQTQAAKRLGISRRTLLSRLDEYGVPRPRKRR